MIYLIYLSELWSLWPLSTNIFTSMMFIIMVHNYIHDVHDDVHDDGCSWCCSFMMDDGYSFMMFMMFMKFMMVHDDGLRWRYHITRSPFLRNLARGNKTGLLIRSAPSAKKNNQKEYAHRSMISVPSRHSYHILRSISGWFSPYLDDQRCQAIALWPCDSSPLLH